ncbi:unnamed protein product [Prorocentrum cordatum]|uniref:Uncharacterized protein n=1 Tax=Prorocentrum cordatum TaxID=2364126 RepID=A0ABN9VMQ0_9DINO|nr:unnamed protein product [Polarella glacialis]
MPDLKVGILGFPDPSLLQAPSHFKNRSASAVRCYSLGGPEPNLLDSPSCFVSLPAFFDRPTCTISKRLPLPLGPPRYIVTCPEGSELVRPSDVLFVLASPEFVARAEREGHLLTLSNSHTGTNSPMEPTRAWTNSHSFVDY